MIAERWLKRGRQEERQEWKAWNERRLAADAAGQPFNEPTPAEKAEQERR